MEWLRDVDSEASPPGLTAHFITNSVTLGSYLKSLGHIFLRYVYNRNNHKVPALEGSVRIELIYTKCVE